METCRTEKHPQRRRTRTREGQSKEAACGSNLGSSHIPSSKARLEEEMIKAQIAAEAAAKKAAEAEAKKLAASKSKRRKHS